MKALISSFPAPICNQCGGPLVTIKKKTKKIEGQKFPITVTTFKCLNRDCQRSIDKAKKERLQKIKERTLKKSRN